MKILWRRPAGADATRAKSRGLLLFRGTRGPTSREADPDSEEQSRAVGVVLLWSCVFAVIVVAILYALHLRK